ncbi:Membrane-bound lytic murein transglycosylase A [uncultured Alphaproteobacteria bacterium]|uniref:peptidoglycan lytic exotransglycosylase n=1 Tax=uncultured Alphaproteobacteria bacterium TaxID=91750 RepID=A0A212KAN3_9PROT|nr:Membrane-bound lytic murein transglycosylase A [uncultured Alphaproteobacteria bacterium]
MWNPDRRFRPGRVVPALLLLLTAACAQPQPQAVAPAKPAPAPAPSGGVVVSAVGYEALPGWKADAVNEALPALARSCAALAKKPPTATVGQGPLARPAAEWQRACATLPAAAAPEAARQAIARVFTPWRVAFADGNPDGLFTGYYEAELNGSLFKSPRYAYPVYGRPVDLVERGEGAARTVGRLRDGRIEPYPARTEIETGGIADVAPVLFWVDSAVDLHIAQIQGSTEVRLADGRTFRIGYAGNNGRPFKGLGRILIDHGYLPPGQATMPDIRAWLHANPNLAQSLMQENPRYIFFRPIEGDGPVGAMGVPLTPRRSLAVDPTVVPLGAPVWLDSVDPDGKPLKRLMVAQDIGSAIKGAVRGDFFWGSGDPALAYAGRMKSTGRYFVLVPSR